MNGGDDNSPPTANLSASPTEAVVGDTVNLDASGSSDPDGDNLTFDWSIQTPDGSDVSVSASSAETHFVADVSGEFLPEVEVSDGTASDTDEVTVSALENVPDEVTISFANRAVDGDTLVAGSLTLDDSTVVENKKSGSFTIAGTRESKQLCAVEDEFFQRFCKQITPTGDQSVTFSVNRKQVTVAVTPTDSSGTALSDAATWIYEPYRSDSTEIDGEGSVDLAKRSGQRTLVSDWITEEPNSSKLDRWRSEEITVSAAENVDREIVVDQLIPACSDGLDNDGDGAVDRAEGPACTDLDGNYDPQDDNEVLKGLMRASGRLFDDSVSVSKTAGERVAKLRSASNALPWSVTVAKGKIKHRIEVQRSDSIPNQSHATHLKTGGSNDNLTVAKTSDVTADADTANGFVLIRVHGIDRSFFADGPHYAVYGWHGCKVRGDCESIDGSGKFYYYAELSDSHLHSWSYVYEPEDVPEKNQQSKQLKAEPAALESGQCRKLSKTDRICRVPADEVSDY